MDLNLFFPDKTELAQAGEAIMACFNCTVRKECEDFKKQTGSKYGIWAGELSKRNDKDED